jgi:pimeloyl-ACP methyl ester carboxylesterase
VPVLLVAGSLDRRFVVLARDLARRLPQAEVCEIADAGHAVHLEQPEAFLRAARDFMRRAERPAIPLPSSSVQEIAS